MLEDLGIDPFKHLLFLDNFEANNKRRWISSGEQYSYFYNDRFLFSSATGTGKCENEMITSPLDLPPAFDVELVGAWKTGADSDAYGILIGSDKDNFDHFGLSGDGRAIVRATRNNAASADLIGWIRMDAINRHAPNRLRVEARGKTWKYYVNGAYIGTVEHKPELTRYTFDQLKISRAPEN